MPKKYKYTIRIDGYGGEFIAGEVKAEFLEALEENGISIEDYAEGNIDDEDAAHIPEDIRPFDPGEWYNIDRPITHATLADSNATIIVDDDETNETVYDSSEDASETSDYYGMKGVEEKPEPFSIYDASDNWSGKCIYTCQRDEDGTFFNATLELDEPFDKDNLLVMTVNFNERSFIAGLIYSPYGPEDERFIDIEWEGGDTEINGATHELRLL